MAKSYFPGESGFIHNGTIDLVVSTAKELAISSILR